MSGHHFTFVCVFTRILFCVCKEVHFYVDPQGSDSNSGLDIHTPVKSIARAVSLASTTTYSGTDLFIELLPGYHDLHTTLTIGHHYGSQLTIRSYKGQEVHVTGGRRISSSHFKPVTDRAILNALPAAARQHVKVVHLPDLNITDYGRMYSYGFARQRVAPLEVFYNGSPLRMARWPNEGFINIVKVIDGPNGHRFQYNSTVPRRWSHMKDLWTYGYWEHSWCDLSAEVSTLNTTSMTVTHTNKTNLIFGMRTGHWGAVPLVGNPDQGGYFRFINVLSELDLPGEYYLDRTTGNLYAWLPTQDGSLKPSDVIYVSTVGTCIQLRDKTSNVVFSNFILEICRKTGLVGNHLRNIQVKNMEIRNTGGKGIAFHGDSRNCKLSKSVLHDSDGGIAISGGNRKLLESGGNVVEDCEIFRFSREGANGRDAILLSGVGNIARYNKLYTGQYTALRYSGNDHIMEYNHIFDTCMNASDCGAIHTGRDWTYRGNKIRYNLVYRTLRYVPGADVRGVMLDDQVSSAVITNNVFYDNEVHVNIGGGRNNVVANNIMYNATRSSMQVDGRGTQRDDYRAYINKKLHDMPYTGTLWTLRYPDLAKIDQNNKTLPEGNQVFHNLVYNDLHKDFIRYSQPWIVHDKYYNVTENGFSYGAGDHYDVTVGDLRVKCHSKAWANHVGFPQVITQNDVGPRFDVGPSFNKIVRKQVQLGGGSSPCTTHAPATNSPMPAYIPDGSGQTPLFNVSDQGCWLHVDKCTNDPKAVGTYRDVYAENHNHAADNDSMCFKRAVTKWHNCGSHPDEVVTAIYGPTGATTFAGEGCFMATYGCPNKNGPADGHVTAGKMFRDVYAEKQQNAAHDESKCLSRAKAQWVWCGSHPNHPVTSFYRPNGTFRTIGSGCWIKMSKCPKDHNVQQMFYDAFGATNAHSDDSRSACFSRAEDYWLQCGSDARYPVTAIYRPTGQSFKYPSNE